MRLVAEAVEAAHQLGIVHRDLKPANVILERAPDGGWRPYVTDFGLARELDKTLTQGMVGTPNFMAPEQARGDIGAIGPLTDVWALGATLFQLLAGKPPFDGDSIMSILRSVELDEPPPLSSVPRDLQAIVFRCLEKAPAKRYAGAAALARDLAAFERGEPVAVRRRGPWRRVSRVLRRFSFALFPLLIVVAGAASFWLRPKSVWKPHIVELPPRYEESAGRMSLSPNGQQLVFSARRGQTTRLYVQPAAGGAAQPLDGTDEGIAPHWSSNGDAIYFAREDSQGPHIERKPVYPPGPPLKLMDGSEAVECAGRLFVVRGKDYERTLIVREPVGAERELVRSHNGLDSPACSHDGKRVAYMRGYQEPRIAWLNLDDGVEHSLPRLGADPRYPVVHHNGTSLLLEVGSADFGSGDGTTLWEQRLDGTRARQITDGGREKNPQLGPNRQLFFEVGQSTRSLSARLLDGGTERSIGAVGEWCGLAGMPDGRLLAVRWLTTDRRAILIVDPISEAETQIAEGGSPQVSADGQVIYYLGDDFRSVWTISLPDGKPRLIAATPAIINDFFAGADALHLGLAGGRAWRQPYDGSGGGYEGPSDARQVMPAAGGWRVALDSNARAVVLSPGPMPQVLPMATRFFDPQLTADRRAFLAYDASNTIWRVEIATGKARALAKIPATYRPTLSPDGKTLYTIMDVRRTVRAVITNYADLPPL
jgi:hypothetical protein